MARLSSTRVVAACALLVTVYALYISSLVLRRREPRHEASQVPARQWLDSSSPLTAILLQQSPVDRNQQLERLKAIDRGWATSACRGQHVYAAMPSALAREARLRSVEVLSLPGEQQETAALRNAVTSFKALLLPRGLQEEEEEEEYEWMVMANDHTFMLAPNLRRFLLSLDSQSMVYTGNLLQRGTYDGRPLVFASGGAGAVFSRPALAALLLAWAVLGIGELDLADIDRAPPCMLSAGNSSQTSSRRELRCALRAARAFTAAPQAHVLTIQLSRRASIALFYKHSQLQVGVAASPGVPLRVLPLRVLRGGCDADGAFARINPGVVMASCLRLLGAASPSSQEEGSAAERFNVYGLLRSLLGDVDGWYRDAKAGLAPGTHDEAGAEGAGAPLRLARELVSLHYVSQAESALLHEALTRPGGAATAARRWPRHGSAGVGAYARGVRNEAEAQLVERFLAINVSVARCDEG